MKSCVGVTPILIQKSDIPPDSLYELMAEAMLDPKLRKVLVHEGVVYQSGTTPTGNAIRREVLLRALEAAKVQGWELVRIRRD